MNIATSSHRIVMINCIGIIVSIMSLHFYTIIILALTAFAYLLYTSSPPRPHHHHHPRRGGAAEEASLGEQPRATTIRLRPPWLQEPPHLRIDQGPYPTVSQRQIRQQLSCRGSAETCWLSSWNTKSRKITDERYFGDNIVFSNPTREHIFFVPRNSSHQFQKRNTSFNSMTAVPDITRNSWQ